MLLNVGKFAPAGEPAQGPFFTRTPNNATKHNHLGGALFANRESVSQGKLIVGRSHALDVSFAFWHFGAADTDRPNKCLDF